MCFHIWRLYQCHTWAGLRVVPADERRKDYSILLAFPACSKRAAFHHRQCSASPLYREFTACVGRHEIVVEVNLFHLFTALVPIEWKS
jgi:hypothetical protein